MINWNALGEVTLVSLAAGVLVVVLVAIALVGLSSRELAYAGAAGDAGTFEGRESYDGAEPVGEATGPAMSAAAGTAVAVICLLAVAAIVVYGLALVIFHK